MKTLSIISLLSFLSICSACSNQPEELVEEKKVEIIEEKPEASTLPRLSNELLNRLFSQANALEGSFYNSGKSVTLWDDNVKGVMAMMIDPPPVSLKTKNLVGHVMILKKDEKSADTIAYIEIYMASSDSYVIFKVDEQKYYHTLTQKGLEFFTQMSTAPAPPQ